MQSTTANVVLCTALYERHNRAGAGNCPSLAVAARSGRGTAVAVGPGMIPRATTLIALAAAAVASIAATGCRDRDPPHEQHGGQTAGGHDHGGGGSTAPADHVVGPGTLGLPDELRALIVAEMVEVESAMHRILSALVRGDLETVATTAQAVHDSFVLAQKLTPDQAEALHEHLPPPFVSLDRQFHGDAAELARTAGAGQAAAAAGVYARMSERCVGCHRAYARERFPGLAGD